MNRSCLLRSRGPHIVAVHRGDQIWRHFATLAKFLKVFGNFLQGLCRIWQYIEHNLVNYHAYVHCCRD